MRRARNPALKHRSYRRTLIWLWTATVLLLLTVPPGQLWRPPPLATAGTWWTSPAARSVMAGVAVGIALGILGFAFASIVLARRNPETRRKLQQSLEQVDFLLPHTRGERMAFAVVALSAGICEEVIFRGFLIRYIAALPLGLGVGVSVLLAALVFGIDHGYQGMRGFVATTAVALILSALFFLSGSLWLPMVLHAAIDLRVLALPTGQGAADDVCLQSPPP